MDKIWIEWIFSNKMQRMSTKSYKSKKIYLKSSKAFTRQLKQSRCDLKVKKKWVLKKNKKSRFENSLNFTTNLVVKEQHSTWTFSMIFNRYDFKSMNIEREIKGENWWDRFGNDRCIKEILKNAFRKILKRESFYLRLCHLMIEKALEN